MTPKEFRQSLIDLGIITKTGKLRTMSDNPLPLKTVLLENCDTEQQKEFAKMLAEQCAIAEQQKTHRCWMQIPDPSEYAIMAKYANSSCPDCGKSAVILEVFHGNLGDSYWLKCGSDCGFKKSATLLIQGRDYL